MLQLGSSDRGTQERRTNPVEGFGIRALRQRRVRGIRLGKQQEGAAIDNKLIVLKGNGAARKIGKREVPPKKRRIRLI